jgi:hypothetical protein
MYKGSGGSTRSFPTVFVFATVMPGVSAEEEILVKFFLGPWVGFHFPIPNSKPDAKRPAHWFMP